MQSQIRLSFPEVDNINHIDDDDGVVIDAATTRKNLWVSCEPRIKIHNHDASSDKP